jgi:hypothetical protein
VRCLSDQCRPRPATVHAQVYNFMAAGLGVTGLARRVGRGRDRFSSADCRDNPDLADHAGATWRSAVLELARRADECRRRAGQVLDFCRVDRACPSPAFFSSSRAPELRVFFHGCRYVQRDEPLRLQDSTRPVAVRLVPTHGSHWHLVACLVNIFIGSSALQSVISVVRVSSSLASAWTRNASRRFTWKPVRVTC